MLLGSVGLRETGVPALVEEHGLVLELGVPLRVLLNGGVGEVVADVDVQVTLVDPRRVRQSRRRKIVDTVGDDRGLRIDLAVGVVLTCRFLDLDLLGDGDGLGRGSSGGGVGGTVGIILGSAGGQGESADGGDGSGDPECRSWWIPHDPEPRRLRGVA